MPYYQHLTETKKQLPIGKIICLARTYRKHAKEMHENPPKDPLLFLKPTSAIIFNNDPIIIPKQSASVHHEIELGIVIKKTLKQISTDEVSDAIYGYVLGLDITARDIQQIAKKHGWPWSIAKGFDTFCPISPIIPSDQIKDPQDLTLTLKVNGTIRQQSSTKHLLFTIPKIISFISHIMTLESGDLILTGTPEGVDEIKPGDYVQAKLNEYTSLTHQVIKA